MRLAHVLIVTALLILCRPTAAQTVYVASHGDDASPGTVERPVKSLDKARDIARATKATTVIVRGGTYALSQTFKLTEKDSGATYRAADGEKVVLVGGRVIGGFKPHDRQIVKTSVDFDVKALIFAGERQHLARWPNYDPANPYSGGWAYVDGKHIPMYAESNGAHSKSSFEMKPQDVRSWANPTDGEVFVFPRYNWWNNILRIGSVDPVTRVIQLKGAASYEIRPGDRYFVQGMLEELDAPGEWYFDSRKKELYFWPPKPLDSGDVLAPTLTNIVLIERASDITFRGFTIECCTGTAVVLKETKHCTIAGCTVRNACGYGAGGISVQGGADNLVTGNDVHHIGSSGISLAGGDRKTLTAAHNVADNNYIHHIGEDYKQGVGIGLTGVGNVASHNLIHDGPRMGIMFSGNNLVIEYNEVRHMNTETEDTGAVYTGGRDWIGSRGSVIRFNYFHDMLGFGYDEQSKTWKSPRFAWGVYLDDNTGGVDVIGNIIARCSRAGIHLHNGRDNVIQNNIFIDNGLSQVEYSGWTEGSRMWREHLPTMIKGYEMVADQPAWRSMRHMDLHPTKAVLPGPLPGAGGGLIMAGNVLERNIIYFHGDAKAYSMRNVAWDHNRVDANLLYHFGQPLKTGITKTGKDLSANLLPNGSFEDGKPNALPTGWTWNVHIPKAQAGSVTDQHVDGERALRIVGIKDGNKHPQINSPLVEMKPGAAYRLTAKVRGDTPGTTAALMGQWYEAKVGYWAREQAITFDDATVNRWRDVELVFTAPAPGESAYKPQMKQMRVRVDFRSDAGTLWVDDVKLVEVERLDEWQSWQAAGNDRQSQIADPLFVAPDHDDFRLRPESPAFKLGFKPIPVEQIGPYASPNRASWPIVQADGAREHR